MSASRTPKVLILSPSASHPQDYGNRNRVFETTTKFKELGYDVHFILYPFESDWVNEVPDSAADMKNAWASFTVIPPSMQLHMPAADTHHQIDEWWDPQIGHYLEWLFTREFFDVFVVNYTFFSRAFEFAPKSTVKVLETHDLFSGRRELFEAFGAGPEFFYTTHDQECIAFDRADIVLAIKDAEAEIIRGMTKQDVISLPYYVQERRMAQRAERTSPNTELRVGFIGALNTVNSLNMQKFLERFAKYQTIYVPNLKICVAGNVCSRLSPAPGVELLGRVEDVKDFYKDIDVIIAPMDFSTGIKIKVGEALSYGKPVVATKNGFDGFPPVDQFHSLENIDAVCRALIKLAADRDRLLRLEESTLVAARLARSRSESGYNALARKMRYRAKKVVFITDQELWKSETVQQGRLAQWCELCSYMARVAIVYVGDKPAGKFASGQQLSKCAVIYDHQNQPDAALQTIESLAQLHDLIEIVISVKGKVGRFFWDRLQNRFANVTLDTWVPELADVAVARGQTAPKDLWLSGAAVAGEERPGRTLTTSAFRYMPGTMNAGGSHPSLSEILAVKCEPEWFDELGIDLLQSTPALAESLSVVESPKDAIDGGESDLFRQLKGKRVPGVILAVGNNVRAVEIVRCIAQYWGSNFIHISSSHFPCMFEFEEETPIVCASYGDLAAYLSQHTALMSEPYAAANAPDAGWSQYWRAVSRHA